MSGDATAAVSDTYLNLLPEYLADQKKKVINYGREFSHILADLCTIDGMTYTGRLLLADIRFMGTFFPNLQNVFIHAQKALEAQRDLFYATSLVNSFPHFIGIKQVVDEVGNRKQRLSLRMPRLNDGGLDWIKILYSVAGVFDTGCYVKKHGLFQLQIFSDIANRLGAVPVFSWKGNIRYFNEIPIIQSLCDKPKELFIFCASTIEVWRWLRPFAQVFTPQRNTFNWRAQFDWDQLLKVIGSAGRVISLAFYRASSRTWWYVTIGLVAQNATEIRFFLLRYRQRQARLSGKFIDGA